ncbi:MAG: DUF2933 domain-containing protein [Caulobacter sp.]|nr:DUF2933 domain-containing protein [Caulobacter sp.]
MTDNPNARRGFPIKTLAIAAFAAALVFLFFGEHRVHMLGWLPFLLLLACPLLHMTMHGGHGGHGGHGAPEKSDASEPEAPHQHNP